MSAREILSCKSKFMKSSWNCGVYWENSQYLVSVGDFLIKDAKMSFTISGDDAYKIYQTLDLKKAGVKSASFDTVVAILKYKGVKIRPKPSDSVRFF